jgi:chemotaxis protein CheZ
LELSKNMTNHWTDILSTELKKLQDANSGVIAQSEVNKLTKEFLTTVDSYVSSEQRKIIYGQIDIISQQITGLKKNISIMGNNILQDNFIPEIATELHSVIAQTEKSVIGILDISDEIGKISAKISPPGLKEELLSHSIKILELCNFQDLTGQIIQRIIKRLSIIESTVNKIAIELGPNYKLSSKLTADSLLNGPQKEEERPSQDKIDNLFSSLPESKL